VDGLSLPNGIGFSPGGDRFYLAESRPQRVHAIDFHASDVTVSNRRVFPYAKDDSGRADALLVDTDGCLWVAFWGVGCVIKYTPSGTDVLRLELPVDPVSSVTFGGSDLSDLYVATAQDGDLKADPRAGDVFRFPGAGQGTKESCDVLD